MSLLIFFPFACASETQMSYMRIYLPLWLESYRSLRVFAITKSFSPRISPFRNYLRSATLVLAFRTPQSFAHLPHRTDSQFCPVQSLRTTVSAFSFQSQRCSVAFARLLPRHSTSTRYFFRVISRVNHLPYFRTKRGPFFFFPPVVNKQHLTVNTHCLSTRYSSSEPLLYQVRETLHPRG